MGNVLWSLPLRIVVGILWIQAGAALNGGVGVLASLVGWLITFGLFTSLASFVAFVTGLVMLIAGQSVAGSAILMTFASLALMNGAGRTVGLDYWVVPFLEKTLGRSLYGKHESRYNDLKK